MGTSIYFLRWPRIADERLICLGESMAAKISAGLFLLVAFAASAAGAEPASATLYLVPFGFLDTSGEPRDQTADHADRLSAMMRDLGTELQSKAGYRIAAPAAGASTCPTGESTCILDQARTAGADLVLAGAVQKVSTMATSLWVGVFEARGGKRVFYRQLTFRGDTDDAWRHATSFLVREIEDDPPKPQ
jgi:hypothetical protein